MWWHKAGQKIVCVNNDGWETWGTIKNNGIYTIKFVVGHKHFYDGGYMPAFHLHEVSGYGCPYFAFRFRPLTDNKTDISIFTKMLKTTKPLVDA